MQIRRDELTILKALAMNDSRSGFVVLGFRDPHRLEGRQGGKNRATDPNGVFSLRRCNNFDFDRGWSKGGYFFLHAIGDT